MTGSGWNSTAGLYHTLKKNRKSKCNISMSVKNLTVNGSNLYYSYIPLIYTMFSKHICKLFHFSSILSNGQCNSYNILMILGKIFNNTLNTSNTYVYGYFTKKRADITLVVHVIVAFPYHIHSDMYVS